MRLQGKSKRYREKLEVKEKSHPYVVGTNSTGYEFSSIRNYIVYITP